MPDVYDIVKVSLNNNALQLRSISQNISNLNTIGFKREAAADFSAVLDDAQVAAEIDDARLGQSGLVSKTRDMSPGAVKITRNPLDLAVLQDGFFAVSNGSGQVLYTRKGTFKVDGSGRIVLGKNEILQGESGDVYLPTGDFAINANGEIIQDGSVIDRIALYRISPGQADYVGEGFFKAVTATILPTEDVNIRQGALEASNVDSTREMLKMVELSRQFESSSKVLGAYDQLLGSAINTLGNF